MARQMVTVFGGSGFIGRHLVQRLAARGCIVRVAVRDPEAALFLKPMGDVGQVVPMAVDVLDPALVEKAVSGAGRVVNLVGILSPWGRQKFDAVHVEGAANIARAAAANGVETLVHVSAAGADAASGSVYSRTKAAGEEAVRAAFPQAVILRPCVVFGPEDDFFNRFAALARFTPVLPVFGCPLMPRISLFQDDTVVAVDIYGDGGTKFQPVYVGDVADAIVVGLDGGDARGATFELGGPQVYSFKALMELLLAHIGRRRLLAPVPFAVAKFEARFLELLPKPLLTRDQVELLKKDNVVGEDAAGFDDLGISPTGVEPILPTYLDRFRPPNRLSRRIQART